MRLYQNPKHQARIGFYHKLKNFGELKGNYSSNEEN
jgi:hypothetical protein